MKFFQGDPAAQRAFVARIDAAYAEGRLLPDAEDKLAAGISPLAVLVGATDLDLFEAETGMPGGLGLLLERIVQGTGGRDRAFARGIVRMWFADPVAGTDLRPAAQGAAILLLDEVLAGGEVAPDVADVLRRIRALHVALRTGSSVDRRDWAAARSAALNLADGCEPGFRRQQAEIAANLAWPTTTSRTVLADALGGICSLAAWQAAETAGWSLARRQEADAAMQQLWDATSAEREADSAAYNFPAVFKRERPDLEPEFVRALVTENVAHFTTLRRLADDLVRLIAA